MALRGTVLPEKAKGRLRQEPTNSKPKRVYNPVLAN